MTTERPAGMFIALIIEQRLRDMAEAMDQAKTQHEAITELLKVTERNLHANDISVLNMSTRVSNALRRNGVTTVEHALYCYFGDTRKGLPFHNMEELGDKAWEELGDALQALLSDSQHN